MPAAEMTVGELDHPTSLHTTSWMVVGTLGFMMLFPVLLLRGMSLDGITYATISRNMADGLGDLWHPFYTATLLNPYYESPPLVFLMESWFFRALGDQWWVERIYSVLTAVMTGAVMVLIWRQLLRQSPRLQRFSWLAVALWMFMPSWFWIYRHNYLENTLGLFAALSVYASLRAMETTRWWAVWTLFAAAAITAAILSKGPVGLFPAITPAVAWLTMRPQSFRKSLLVQITLVVFLAGSVGLVLARPAAREYLSAYFERQVVASLQGERDVVESALGRFHLAWALAVDLVFSGTAAAALVLWARTGRKGTRAGSKTVGDCPNFAPGTIRRMVAKPGTVGHAAACPMVGTVPLSETGFETSSTEQGLGGPTAFCVLTALSASLPIMISPKQSAYYAAPSWPFYTMALALWCLPAISILTTRWTTATTFPRSTRRLRIAAVGLIAATVAASPLWWGMIFRDRELIDDVARIGQIVARRSTIQIDPALRDEWSLHAYLYRRHYISLEAGVEGGMYRLEPAEGRSAVPPGYTFTDSGMTQFRLYVRSDIATVSIRTEQAE
jgi:4-amino-4-deoxy-L-arabinose transferase-like glycosyltransferase